MKENLCCPALKVMFACPYIIPMPVLIVFTVFRNTCKNVISEIRLIPPQSVFTFGVFSTTSNVVFALCAHLFPAVPHSSCLLPPSVFFKLPQQFQSSVWTTWKRTTTTQFPRCQCLALPAPPHYHPALAALAHRQPAGSRAPCCRTVSGRTAGTTGPGPPVAVRETLWSAATPALSSCPRPPRTRPPWMTARGPSPAPRNLATPCSGRDTPTRPTHHQSETALPEALRVPSGPSPIERNLR